MKNKLYKNINNKNKTKKKKNKGGKVLASGGFGCVFDPALKCQGETNREENKISKLMTEKHAKQEYEEINLIKEKLDNIPNYKNYFLLHDINLCEPAKLNQFDLENFTSKCKALPKDNITKDNINSKLSETMILNMPNGGIAMDDYFYNEKSIQSMININKGLIELLKNGIIPMNKNNVYHNDIKDSNILVNSLDNPIKCRLIDWGLSTIYIPFKNEVFPNIWRNRPLQFNVPFSVIIFSEDFIEKYSKYIEKGGKIEKAKLQKFVFDYILCWIKKRGPGNYKFINEIMYMLFKSEVDETGPHLKNTIETEFTMFYMIEYIVEILLDFTKFRENGTLNLRDYLDNIFIKNVDLWGFCSAYYPYLELLSNNYEQLNINELKLFDLVKDLFITIYTTSSIEINPNKILENLEKIHILLEVLSVAVVPISKPSLTKLKTTTKKIRNVKMKSNISFKNEQRF